MTHGEAGTERDLEPAVCTARHGIAVPRGQSALAGSSGGRFGRLFGSLAPCDPPDDVIEALRKCTTKGQPSINARIPAGYTYLGQFIDHDITFDPLSKLQRDNDPHALVNFRTPRFDLDSVYGSGPADQPFLYDWGCDSHAGVKLLVGHNPSRRHHAAIDLPRNEQGRALVGDARNDENRIVSQLHLLFIHFHNKIVDRICAEPRRRTSDEVFAEAQRIVRWHYQWIVVHDFLRRIVGWRADRLLRHGVRGSAPIVKRRFYTWRDEPVMPVEFSGAAYRFGHSMVRTDYNVNATALNIPIFRRRGEPGAQLGGFQRLSDTLVIDWKLFFFETTSPRPPLNPSMRIDPLLASRLSALPPDGAALARLNLERGRALGLPSGADVARAMSVQPLTDKELARLIPEDLDRESKALVRSVLHELPLWLYVLLEAKSRGRGGQQLGPVGGQIVAEVLVGLLEADPSSWLMQWPTWRPELSDKPDGDFTMLDLVDYLQDPARL